MVNQNYKTTCLALIMMGAFCLGLTQCTDNPSNNTVTSEVYDGMPPHKYRGNIIATQVTFTDNVARDCAKAGLKDVIGTEVKACAIISDNRREVVILNPCLATGPYARDFCHEVGHLNLWPYDHPR